MNLYLAYVPLPKTYSPDCKIPEGGAGPHSFLGTLHITGAQYMLDYLATRVYSSHLLLAMHMRTREGSGPLLWRFFLLMQTNSRNLLLRERGMLQLLVLRKTPGLCLEPRDAPPTPTGRMAGWAGRPPAVQTYAPDWTVPLRFFPHLVIYLQWRFRRMGEGKRKKFGFSLEAQS